LDTLRESVECNGLANLQSIRKLYPIRMLPQPLLRALMIWVSSYGGNLVTDGLFLILMLSNVLIISLHILENNAIKALKI